MLTESETRRLFRENIALAAKYRKKSGEASRESATHHEGIARGLGMALGLTFEEITEEIKNG